MTQKLQYIKLQLSQCVTNLAKIQNFISQNDPESKEYILKKKNTYILPEILNKMINNIVKSIKAKDVIKMGELY